MTPPRVWPDDVPPAGTSSWYVRSARLPLGRWQVRCYVDPRHPDGEVVADPGDLTGDFLLWDADVDGTEHPVLRINPAVCPGAPDIWFVHLDERHAVPGATTLVAFATDHLPPGTIVTDPEFFHMPVRSDEQVGAIRWWQGEAVVDQLYVRDDMRRHHVGTVLIYAASGFHQFNGWTGRLHSDGRRTTLGDAFVTGLRHPDRIARLTERLSPMDPSPAAGHSPGAGNDRTGYDQGS